MGFAVPAALGAQIGSGLRPIVLSGDGAFQMTGPEISHAPNFGANPIVLVINNGGWGIFRPIAERRELLDIPPWPYANLAREWGGAGFQAHTPNELREALENAHRVQTFSIIDVRVERDDLSPVTVKYIKAAAKHSQTPPEKKRTIAERIGMFGYGVVGGQSRRHPALATVDDPAFDSPRSPRKSLFASLSP